MPKLLTVIIPCYNEEENIRYFYEEFCKNDALLFETCKSCIQLLFVDDGSTDGTVTENQELTSKG